MKTTNAEASKERRFIARDVNSPRFARKDERGRCGEEGDWLVSGLLEVLAMKNLDFGGGQGPVPFGVGLVRAGSAIAVTPIEELARGGSIYARSRAQATPVRVA